jgi:hypothetical protein
VKNCKLCGGLAVEQIRGQLTPADKGYVAPAGSVDSSGVNAGASSNAPANATDTRVVCANTNLVMHGPGGALVTIPATAETWNASYSGDGFIFPACDNQTGWGKAAQADYTRFLWDRDHGGGTIL